MESQMFETSFNEVSLIGIERLRYLTDRPVGKALCQILKNIRIEKAKELGVDYTLSVCTNKRHVLAPALYVKRN